MEFIDKYPIQMFFIFKLLEDEDKNLLYYKTDKAKNDNIWMQELTVLRSTYPKLKLKVDQLVPIHSRHDDYKWFLLKDEYRFISFTLASSDDFSEGSMLHLRKIICQDLRDQEDVICSNNQLLKVRSLIISKTY